MLDGRLPGEVKLYLTRLQFYFVQKKITDDLSKVAWAGQGLAGDVELEAWHEGEISELKWDEYKDALLERTMPRDYEWDVMTEMRSDKQGGGDYVEFSTRMRARQLLVGLEVISNLDLVTEMLFNMDSELRRYLRVHKSLLASGLGQEQLRALGRARALQLPSDPANIPLPPTVDFREFDQAARDQWILIAANRRTNAQQFNHLARAALPKSTPPTVPSFVKSTRPTSSPSTTVAVNPSSSYTNIPKLTDLQRAYFDATEGCRKCRKPFVGHRTKECPNGFATVDFVVPSSFKPGDVVAQPSGTGVGVAALDLLNLDDEDADTDDFYSTDSESEE